MFRWIRGILGLGMGWGGWCSCGEGEGGREGGERVEKEGMLDIFPPSNPGKVSRVFFPCV